ncbi:unnamed protein product [marine sediment metagenome]|uniref:Uncharacterized protein n=1 Tax=marine sediment metagenome TaxID=412755 RepID=X0U8K9_9ZZZZ
MITELIWHDVEDEPEIKTGIFLVWGETGFLSSTVYEMRYSTAIYQGKSDKKTQQGETFPEWLIPGITVGAYLIVRKWAYLDQGEK